MESSYLQVLPSVLPYLIPKIVIVVASIYYYLKIKSRVAAIMATGSFMSISSTLYSQIYLLFNYQNSFASNNYKLISTISTIGYILFTVGFALLIIDLVKKKEKTKNKDNQNGVSGIGISRYN